MSDKGYMTWDYDADIAMQREECEKFRKVVNEENLSTAIFLSHYKDSVYLRQYEKNVHI